MTKTQSPPGFELFPLKFELVSDFDIRISDFVVHHLPGSVGSTPRTTASGTNLRGYRHLRGNLLILTDAVGSGTVRACPPLPHCLISPRRYNKSHWTKSFFLSVHGSLRVLKSEGKPSHSKVRFLSRAEKHEFLPRRGA